MEKTTPTLYYSFKNHFNHIFYPIKVNIFTYSIIPSIIIITAKLLLVKEFSKIRRKLENRRRQSTEVNLRPTIIHGLFVSLSFVIVSFTRSITILIVEFNLNNKAGYFYASKIESIANIFYVFLFFIMLVKNKMFYLEFKNLFFNKFIKLYNNNNNTVL